ncbi:MAG: GTP cyclohydrolase II [Candidatus Gracilibacteria bacterium]|nr:GTP cyclohydrolase II [Candidatus Gracilibacteria bacterium]
MSGSIERMAVSVIETEFGEFEILVYKELESGKEHVVLKKEWGDLVPLVRIHSSCMTGDIFASVYCDCRSQLHQAMKKVSEQGGLIVYLDQEARGLGLTHKIKAYELQRQGMDTVEADEKIGEGVDLREYELAADMLKDVGVNSLQLMTNNPRKVESLVDQGLEVVRVEHVVKAQSERGMKYLMTKRKKMNHLIEDVEYRI